MHMIWFEFVIDSIVYVIIKSVFEMMNRETVLYVCALHILYRIAKWFSIHREKIQFSYNQLEFKFLFCCFFLCFVSFHLILKFSIILLLLVDPFRIYFSVTFCELDVSTLFYLYVTNRCMLCTHTHAYAHKHDSKQSITSINYTSRESKIKSRRKQQQQQRYIFIMVCVCVCAMAFRIVCLLIQFQILFLWEKS